LNPCLVKRTDSFDPDIIKHMYFPYTPLVNIPIYKKLASLAARHMALLFPGINGDSE